MLYHIQFKFMMTMDLGGCVGGHTDLTENVLFISPPSIPPNHPHTCSCVYVYFTPQLCQALGCVVPARIMGPRCYCCGLFAVTIKFSVLSSPCYKSKHWSVTESKESLENNFTDRGYLAFYSSVSTWISIYLRSFFKKKNLNKIIPRLGVKLIANFLLGKKSGGLMYN